MDHLRLQDGHQVCQSHAGQQTVDQGGPPWSTVCCPAYLAADCQLVSDEGRRQLRSADSADLCRQADLHQLLETDVSRLPARSCGNGHRLRTVL